jgi:hypothetical protein
MREGEPPGEPLMLPSLNHRRPEDGSHIKNRIFVGVFHAPVRRTTTGENSALWPFVVLTPRFIAGGLGRMDSGKPFKRFLLGLGLFFPLDESRG